MAAATAMRSARGGGVRRPFAPVAVSPPPPPSREANQLAQEEAVLGGGAGAGKTAKKTPAAGRALSRRRVGSCAKRCSTPASKAKAKAKPACDAPRAPVPRGVSGEEGGKARAAVSSPHGSEAGQERRGGEDSAASRKLAMEETMAGLPEPGEGRVKYLVDTFERLLSLAAGGGAPDARGGGGARSPRRVDEAATAATAASTPATPHGAEEINVSYASIGGGGGPDARGGGARSVRRENEAATAAAASTPVTPRGAEEIDVSSRPSIASCSEVSFPAIAGVACILDASDRTSMINRARGQRRHRTYSSTGSSVRGCTRKVTRVTSQQPFNLRTEQRGKAKVEDFVQRLRKMQMEEERLCNPLAQNLPYTTDEPETPAKPPMKEPTEPIDLVLHSDVRAIGRAKFDHQVTERISFMEEVKLERKRQQKVDEEIEIKQLRKQQVPRAHPMPDFTRPFQPKRSVKPQTIPREPRFHPRLMRHVSKA
ncbi:unnamed protein product [Urochloa decumbens]|uniref:TPX2 C-terminal domain-containing protein n=1 Tax=Urochloa decumbens TaxID=240449 RepID=A0ABC8VXM3_9POAL